MSELSVPTDAAMLERVVVGGDLSKLSPADRTRWYMMRCEAAGLDPRTQPFQYLQLQGKLVLYASRTATDQLRARHGISCDIAKSEMIGDVYVVTVNVTSSEGRRDSEIGAVCVKGLVGDALANALMKAITKAKRRATLCITGLGMLDESEVDTIPGAVRVAPDAVSVVPAWPAPSAEPPGDDEAATASNADRRRRVNARLAIRLKEFGVHSDDRARVRYVVGHLIGRELDSLRSATVEELHAAVTALVADDADTVVPGILRMYDMTQERKDEPAGDEPDPFAAE